MGTTERLGLRGGSNGGSHRRGHHPRPDLFRAAVCDVPVMRCDSFPLFGNGKAGRPNTAARDPEQSRPMLPIHPTTRPKWKSAIRRSSSKEPTATTAVDPMTPGKFAAAMQAVASDLPGLAPGSSEYGATSARARSAADAE